MALQYLLLTRHQQGEIAFDHTFFDQPLFNLTKCRSMNSYSEFTRNPGLQLYRFTMGCIEVGLMPLRLPVS